MESGLALQQRKARSTFAEIVPIGMRAYQQRMKAPPPYVPPHALERDGMSQQLARTLEDMEYTALYWEVWLLLMLAQLRIAGSTLAC